MWVCHVSSEDLSHLVSDFTRFYILDILYEEPTHGYRILQKYKRRVGKSISPGLVYPFLHQLEEKGLITHTNEMVGEKERKIYKLSDNGRRLCIQLFRRFSSLISTALEPSLDVCVHCGCKVYEGGHREVIEGVEMSFCCVHCAKAYKEERGAGHGTPT